MSSTLYKIILLTLFIPTFSSTLVAEDYYPQVPSNDPNVCYKEIEVCKNARQFRDQALEAKLALEESLPPLQLALASTKEKIAAILEDLDRETQVANSLSFLPNSSEQKAMRKIQALHKKEQRLASRGASEKRLQVMRKRILKAQRNRSELLVQHEEEYRKTVLEPLQSVLALNQVFEKSLQGQISELNNQIASAAQDEIDFDIFQEGFCTSYLAMCLPSIGTQCFSAPQTSLPDPVLYPEYLSPAFKAHSASVMFRRERDCATGKALGREDIIILDGTKCNYVCRTRLPEDCFADGTFDSYIDERCFDNNGDLIQIEVPDVANQ